MKKMIVCKGCGAELPKGVKKCPQCGKKIKSPTGIIILAVVIVLILIAVIFGRDKKSENDDVEYSWPTSGIATLLPQPESIYGEVISDSEDHFSITVYRVSQNDFNAYVDACKEEGFTVDYNGSSSSYFAEDSKGNSISLFYDEDEKEMSIRINAYEEEEEDTSSSGKDDETNTDTEDTSSSDEGNTTNTDTTSSDDENNEANTDTEAPSDETPTASNDTEFRAWVDSYEAFMNEYVDFMKKYSESDGTDLSLLSDYATYMSKYAEYIEATENVSEDELSVEDYQYFLAAQTRVLQKLSEVQ